MSKEQEKILVRIKYRDVEQVFTGGVDEVWTCVNRFFSETFPAFEAARKVVLTVDFQQLLDECKDVVAVAREGVSILVSRRKLTDSETLLLYLLAAYIGYRLGLLKSDVLSKDELQSKLGKSAKIASTRLGELCRNGMVVKTEGDNYKLTTFGVNRLKNEILPRIRMKI